jgi:hypothetical protein
MPVIQEGLTKLGQSRLRSNRQETHVSNPVLLQHYSGRTSLDPKITRRMSPPISNKRRIQAKLSACFVNNYATKSCVSGGTAPYIVGSRFTTGLRSRIFGGKSNRRKTSTI